MILLSIGYSKGSDDICSKITEMCRTFKEKGINIAIVENDIGNMHYIKCILRDTDGDIKLFEESRELFYTCSSNIIYDFISYEYEIEMIEKLIKENYNYMTDEDGDEIKKRCLSIIVGSGLFTAGDLIVSINRKNSTLKKIEEYLSENNEIILDGFITFRLKELKDELTGIIDRVVEEYVVEKEYSEFIKLLKYFVDIQDSRYDTVNIFISPGGEYRIEDGLNNNITKEFFEDFNEENIKGEINKHDMLVSALITCAPKSVIIHGVQNAECEEAIDTIKSIFLDKLSFCTGCDRCKKLIPDLKIQKSDV